MSDQTKFRLPPVKRENSFAALNFHKIGWHIRAHEIDRCHQITKGAGIDVVIVDTGIDSEHPELRGKVKSRFNATDETVLDGNGHGTHVAGIIAGSKNMTGVAPDVNLHDAKVMTAIGEGGLNEIMTAIKYYVNKGMKLFNLSLGTDYDDPVFRKFIKDMVVYHNVVFICAAGNDGAGVDFPAAYSRTTSVAAVYLEDQSWKKADFSSVGPEVTISAAGVRILSSVPNGGYEEFSGTSMASPIVTGVMALLMSAKDNNLAELEAILQITALDILDSGFDHLTGHGVINPYQALSDSIEVMPDIVHRKAPKGCLARLFGVK